jgi:hypothetical protein
MDTMWEKIKKGLKDGAQLSVEKIEELGKIAKLKVEEQVAKHKISRNFVDMGERVFDLVEAKKGAQIEGDLALKTSIENIKALRAEIVEIGKKILAIREAAKKAHGNPEDSSDDDEAVGI